jgi:hypothetical protein
MLFRRLVWASMASLTSRAAAAPTTLPSGAGRGTASRLIFRQYLYFRRGRFRAQRNQVIVLTYGAISFFEALLEINTAGFLLATAAYWRATVW